MGLLSHFIVASRDDALRYEALRESEATIPPDRFQIAESKNSTPLALGKLWAALCNEKWNANKHDLEHVGEPRSEGPWLFRFPAEFTHLLSSLDNDLIDRIAGAWVGEEVSGNADVLKPVLRDLRHLAGQVRLNGKGLYLLVSL